MPPPIERKLAAIMFTDIADYTALSPKLNSTDRKRFFSEHKWVSQIVENWEKVK